MIDEATPDSTAEMEVQEHHVAVAGHRVRYLQAGSGPALLLIHGLLGYSFSWRFAIPALAKHFTVFAPDLPGTGYSERIPGLDCGMRASAGRMLQFCQSVGLDEIDLLGTSHGGGVASLMTVMAGEQGHPGVRRMVLVAPVNPWSEHGKTFTRWLASAAGGALFRAVWPILPTWRRYWLARMFGDPRRIPPDSVEGYTAAIAVDGTLDYVMSVMRCWHSDLAQLESVYPRLSRIPTLLMWGDRDSAVLPESAEKLHNAIPGSQLLFFPGVGHLPYEETPEQFNRALLDFLLRR